MADDFAVGKLFATGYSNRRHIRFFVVMDSNLFGWGSNSHGQLGLNFESEAENAPVLLKNIAGIKKVYAGGKHSEFIDNLTEWSCGDNDKGQLRNNERSLNKLTPVLHKFSDKSENIVKISCGWDFSLGLLQSGQVLGCGSNNYGQLGIDFENTAKPLKIEIPFAIDVACGLRHSAIVTQNGQIFAAGSNSKCQLGLEASIKKSKTFIQIDNIFNAKLVACGENFTICLTNNGVFGWGDNKFGQLGIFPDEPIITKPRKLKIQLFEGDTIKKIFCGWTHAAILTEKGFVITWGRNNYGQLGEIRPDDKTWQSSTLKTEYRFKDLAVGSHHVLGLTTDKRVVAWGWNEHGSCGDGTFINRFCPTLTLLNQKVDFIATGAAHCFAILNGRQ